MEVRSVAPSELPITEVWAFDAWQRVPVSGSEMEFRLIYDGRLPAASQNDTRSHDKHAIRRVLGKQLAELWRTHPRLKAVSEEYERHLQNPSTPRISISTGDL